MVAPSNLADNAIRRGDASADTAVSGVLFPMLASRQWPQCAYLTSAIAATCAPVRCYRRDWHCVCQAPCSR